MGMPLMSLSQTYRIAPLRDAASAPSPQPAALTADRESRQRGEHEAADERACDSVRRSPLLRALLRALRLPDAAPDVHLERALIAFARALNLASGDAEGVPQPAVSRAGDAAQRRARHEELLLAAFAELLHTAGRPGVATREALQVQLGDCLHALAGELHVDDERAGEATQPGSLISVRA